MKSLVSNTIVSIFTTALDFGVLAFLVEIVHANYVFATFCGTVVGALSNFFLNRHWSFEATHITPQTQLVRFVPVQAGSSGLQTLGVWLFTDRAHLQYMASKLVVATLVQDLGFAPVDTGSLRDGGRLLQAGGPLAGRVLSGAEARAAIRRGEGSQSAAPGGAAHP